MTEQRKFISSDISREFQEILVEFHKRVICNFIFENKDIEKENLTVKELRYIVSYQMLDIAYKVLPDLKRNTERKELKELLSKINGGIHV